jgi:hypothetical protein
VILGYNFPGKSVNVHASLAENVDAVMPIQYSSFRPSFQATLLSRQ